MFHRIITIRPQLAVRVPPRISVQGQSRTAYQRFRPPGEQYQKFNQRTSVRDLWKNPLVRKLTYGTGIAGTVIYVSNLETVPVSGRRRFNVISPEFEAHLAKQMYAQTIQQLQGGILPANSRTTRYVKKVLDRLIPVTGLEEVEWEVIVIKDDSTTNAFVIPGGKVFVFTGILPICGDEDGLAAILSHEIAHTVARHSSERLSKYLLVIAALFVASVTVGDPGIGRLLMDLAFLKTGSRKQEAEADYIGLMLMAQACYDPERAVTLWERMEKAQQMAPPEFLSTHPSNQRRIHNIQEWLPEAKMKQDASDCASTLDYARHFKKAFGVTQW